MWSHQTVTSFQGMLRDKIGYRREIQTVFNLLYLVDCGHEGWLGDESSLNTKLHRLMFNLGNRISIRLPLRGRNMEGAATSSLSFLPTRKISKEKSSSKWENSLRSLCKRNFHPLFVLLTFCDSFWRFRRGSEDRFRKRRNLFSRTGGGLAGFFLCGEACW